MEDKEKIMGILRSRAIKNLSTTRKSNRACRGIGSNTRGINKSLVFGKVINIEFYRLEKFLNRLYLNGDCICLPINTLTGYSTLFLSTKGNYLSHRFIYQFYIGSIPEGFVIDHICRNRSCVNPMHLRAVTQRVNILSGNGATAKHAIKTHCNNGHEFNNQNTYRIKCGRQCRLCRDAYMKIYRDKNKEKLRISKNRYYANKALFLKNLPEEVKPDNGEMTNE